MLYYDIKFAEETLVLLPQFLINANSLRQKLGEATARSQ